VLGMPSGELLEGRIVSGSDKRSRWWIAAGSLMLVLLAAAVFTLGSLSVPIPSDARNLPAVFALSTFLFSAFLVFGSILARTLVRIWMERRAGRLGARFKTKMVLGAAGISLLPLIFLFFVSYALVNRTLNLWFPRPLEISNSETQALLDEMTQREHQHLLVLAEAAAAHGGNLADVSKFAKDRADAAWLVGQDGKVISTLVFARELPADESAGPPTPMLVKTLPDNLKIWSVGRYLYMAAGAATPKGLLEIGARLPGDFLDRLGRAEAGATTYEAQRQQIRTYKRQILFTLSLATLLLLFATTWVALYLSKQVTVPIQALAEATEEVARGNLGHRVTTQTHDELGMLVNSFNQMTVQLDESRRQIDDFTRNLQQAFEERESRRTLMEAILENIPTGVISLDAEGGISRVNTAVVAIFGEYARSAKRLEELAGEDASRGILQLMRRSLRMGAVSKELEIRSGGRVLHAAVTVSSLGPRRSNAGYVVVIDDVTDLLRAQRAAAWQEVAQRIAHEIKNPLTPIRLSAERLLRYLDRNSSAGEAREGLERMVNECARLISQEAVTLATLVDEFSQFVRFPAAKLQIADVNKIVESALDLFHGRLDGIEIKRELGPKLAPVRADEELLRRVVANLVDNAAEAMEGTPVRRLEVITRAKSHGDAVEIEVADTGCGLAPEDKDLLFLPHFSTKERGTGLGLAIASRIVEDHHGTLRVEDNLPSGARFIIRLPAAEGAVAPAASAGTFWKSENG
jgi:two-component system nitrogen regulation sensor histidine kinase NtrY